ncbi:MAG: threonylcarbamoyl-AMP synthase [Anaerolineales bacterium]|nr:threonylcarbamoyl-AMP synthase [Anaerolineales bacterium]
MKTQIIPVSDPLAYSVAQDLLEVGELVAFPTDTVYGVGTPVFNKQGIANLYTAKLRDTTKAIPILLSDVAELTRVAARISDTVMKLAQRYWPGPLTLVMHRCTDLPPELSPYPTIGVRMPDHPIALNILRMMGPMAVTSANLSGQVNACTAQEVMAQLGGRIAMILDGGQTPGGIPSTVVDLSGIEPVILRTGPISLDDIERVIHSGGL